AKFVSWATQGGRNAFNRAWSYCCGWAFACKRGADGIGPGERCGDRASGGGHRNRESGALLVHLARMARLLPSLALLVMRL
ncbi:MAG: hypothetical protein ACXU9A_20265, partial [Xanthobacteraceae bacterium]